jgi:hypothetical protein
VPSAAGLSFEKTPPRGSQAGFRDISTPEESCSVECPAFTVTSQSGMLLVSVASATAQGVRNTPANAGNACADDNGGITLSPGFCATVFANNIRPDAEHVMHVPALQITVLVLGSSASATTHSS